MLVSPRPDRAPSPQVLNEREERDDVTREETEAAAAAAAATRFPTDGGGRGRGTAGPGGGSSTSGAAMISSNNQSTRAKSVRPLARATGERTDQNRVPAGSMSVFRSCLNWDLW